MRGRVKRYCRFVRAVLRRASSRWCHSWTLLRPSALIRRRDGPSRVPDPAEEIMAVVLNLLFPPMGLRALEILAPLICATGVGRWLWFC